MSITETYYCIRMKIFLRIIFASPKLCSIATPFFFFFFFLPSVSRHLVIKFERQFRSGKKRGTRAPHISSLLAVVKTDYAIERGAEEEDRNARNARVVDEVGTSRGMDRNGYPTHGTVLSFRARDLFPRWLFTRSNPPTAGFVGTVDKSVHPREKVNGCRLHPEGRWGEHFDRTLSPNYSSPSSFEISWEYQEE